MGLYGGGGVNCLGLDLWADRVRYGVERIIHLYVLDVSLGSFGALCSMVRVVCLGYRFTRSYIR